MRKPEFQRPNLAYEIIFIPLITFNLLVLRHLLRHFVFYVRVFIEKKVEIQYFTQSHRPNVVTENLVCTYCK